MVHLLPNINLIGKIHGNRLHSEVYLKPCQKLRLSTCLTGFLTLSWRRPLSHRNQSIDLLCKSMDWFLYDRNLRHERANTPLSSICFVAQFSLVSFYSQNLPTQNATKNSLAKIRPCKNLSQ